MLWCLGCLDSVLRLYCSTVVHGYTGPCDLLSKLWSRFVGRESVSPLVLRSHLLLLSVLHSAALRLQLQLEALLSLVPESCGRRVR